MKIIKPAFAFLVFISGGAVIYAQQSGMPSYMANFALWSPAQDKIMFQLSGQELQVMTAEGESVYKLKIPEGLDQPAISPDGDYLSYIVLSKGLYIYSFIDESTMQVFPITNDKTIINRATWSFNGKKLLFKVVESSAPGTPGSAKYYVFDLVSRKAKLIMEIKGV